VIENKFGKKRGVSHEEIKNKLAAKRQHIEEKTRKKKAEERKKNFDDIFKKITTDEIDRLNHSLTLTNEMLNNEDKRGKSAEKRIYTFFAVWGVISGLFTIFSKYLPITTGNFSLLIFFVSIAILILILKMGYYFWVSIRVRNAYIIWPSTIYNVQEGSKAYALRYEIARKIHNYYDQIGPNTEKLYCLEQMQNNLILIIVFFLLIGFLSILNTNNTFKMPQYFSIILGLASILVAIIFDRSYVRFFRKFWH
jgi:hypothetical protein